MLRSVWVGCLVLLLLAITTCSAEQLLLKEKITVSTGGYYLFHLPNKALLDWRFLWSSRQVSVLAPDTDTNFEVYYSPVQGAIESKLQTGDETAASQIYQVDCSRELKHSRRTCSLYLSYYGISLEWWMPRVEYLFEAPPPVYVAVHLPDTSLFGSQQQKELHVELYDHTPWQLAAAIQLGSIALFLLSPFLSTSLRFYLAMWFLAGALFSVVVLVIGAIWVGMSISPRASSVVGAFSLLMAMSCGLFYYSRLVAFVTHPEQHRIWIIIVIAGGLIGLLYGYTNKLEPEKIAQIAFFIRFFSLGMIFFSLSQTESALLIVAVLAVVLPWLQSSFSPLIEDLLSSDPRKGRKKSYDSMIVRSPKGKISMEEYVDEGIALTSAGVEDLITFYRANPLELNKLSVPARLKTCRLMEMKRRELRK